MNFVGSIPRGKRGISGFQGKSGFSGYSGISGFSGYSGFAPASNPSAVVSGAGTVAANGTYTNRGEAQGKAFYTLVGQPSSEDTLAINWDGSQWNIFDDMSNILYTSTDDTEFPWLVVTWSTDTGTPPVPTVTQG